jgi:Ca2+-binding EF-hand superfamily protein
MNSAQKEQIRRQILDESVFGPMVDKTFYDADLDKSGFIEKAELKILLKGIHATLGLSAPTQSEINSELKRLDLNTDGKISKEEFRTLVKDLAMFSVDQM